MSNSFQNSEITLLPSITEIEFKKINKNYFKVILINFLIIFFLLSAGLVTLYKLDVLKEYTYFIYISFITFFCVVLIYLKLSFPKRKYALREKDISYRSGLYLKKTTTVPFSRIQHVEIDEKPISRLFKLASLSVFTAGDSSDDLVVKGVTKEDALKIKEFITANING